MNPIETLCSGGTSYSLTAKVPGALTLYQSFFAKVSVFFLRPFFPFERRLFLPTAMIATLVVGRRGLWCCRVVDRDNSVASWWENIRLEKSGTRHVPAKPTLITQRCSDAATINRHNLH